MTQIVVIGFEHYFNFYYNKGLFRSGGPAGVNVCKELQKKNKSMKITLIEPRDSFYHVIGFPRAIVDEQFQKHLFWKYSDIFKQGNILHNFFQKKKKV